MGNFIDYVKIYCRSGAGGPGSHFMRREKYVAFGGPAGGDGGRGGHVILRGNSQHWTLLPLKFKKHTKLIMTDTLGNLLWQRTYWADTLNNAVNGLTKTTDGGVVYCGNYGRYNTVNFGLDYQPPTAQDINN